MTIAQIDKSILDWLNGSDLADDSNLTSVITNWSDYIITPIENSNNLITLFNNAYLSRLPLQLGIFPWTSVNTYFNNFMTGTGVTE